MCLNEDTQDSITGLPEGRFGLGYGATHIGTGYEGEGRSFEGVVVIVEPHYDFGVAVVDRDSGYLNKNFARS